MAKQKKRDGYVSKGIVGNPSKTGSTKNEKIMHQLNRWYKEKPTKVRVPSIDNPHIMVKVDAIEAWGYPRPKYKVTAQEEI